MIEAGLRTAVESRSLTDAFMSASVNWQPHTPHAHCEAANFIVVLGCHFFDISALHSGQFMLSQSFLSRI